MIQSVTIDTGRGAPGATVASAAAIVDGASMALVPDVRGSSTLTRPPDGAGLQCRRVGADQRAELNLVGPGYAPIIGLLGDHHVYGSVVKLPSPRPPSGTAYGISLGQHRWVGDVPGGHPALAGNALAGGSFWEVRSYDVPQIGQASTPQPAKPGTPIPLDRLVYVEREVLMDRDSGLLCVRWFLVDEVSAGVFRQIGDAVTAVDKAIRVGYGTKGDGNGPAYKVAGGDYGRWGSPSAAILRREEIRAVTASGRATARASVLRGFGMGGPPVDTTPPAIVIDVQPPAEVTQGDTFAYHAAATDASGVAQLEAYLDGLRYDLDPGSTLSGDVPTQQLSLGEHTFQVRATDNAGNPASSAVLRFTVKAPPPPPSGPSYDELVAQVALLEGELAAVRAGVAAETQRHVDAIVQALGAQS